MSAGLRDTVRIRNEIFVPFISTEEIHDRVLELAAAINGDFSGKNPIFVCVLNGAFMFFSDLVRNITIDCEVDFIKLSSYGDEKISSGDVRMVKDVSCEVRNRHVILVEDIVDTGYSIEFLKKWITGKQPASVTVATLLHKPEQTKVNNNLDYVGFSIPPRFVIGYGLDYGQFGRNLPAVYILSEGNGMRSGKE